jgi:predicted nucleic acid-binding protein
MTVMEPDRTDFDHTWEQFARYGDHELSFTDSMADILGGQQNSEHVFTFDPDHSRTRGFTAVPADTGES